MPKLNCVWISRVLGIFLVIAYSSGCSFIGVRPPRHVEDTENKVTCTRSRAAPIADTVAFGFALLFATVSVSGRIQNGDNGAGTSTPFMVTMVGLTGVFASSAVYGYYNTSYCKKHTTPKRYSALDGPFGAPIGTTDWKCDETRGPGLGGRGTF